MDTNQEQPNEVTHRGPECRTYMPFPRVILPGHQFTHQEVPQNFVTEFLLGFHWVDLTDWITDHVIEFSLQPSLLLQGQAGSKPQSNPLLT